MNKRVRAVIVEDNKVLLMRRVKHGEEYWVFPGGGLEDNDMTPESGLKRECLEELGINIEVNGLLIEKVSSTPNENGQIQSYYICNIVSGKVGSGIGPEFSDRDIEKYGTYEVVWVNISDLKGKKVYPFEVRDIVISKKFNSSV